MGSTEQLYNLTWGEFNNSLSSTVQTLRCHGDLVDVTLTAGGKIFPAHKLVLGSASPLLMELLKSTKCEHPVIMLAGITANDLEALLQFVYNGEVSVDPSQLPSLLQAAQCLNIQALSPSILSVDVGGTRIPVLEDGQGLGRGVAWGAPAHLKSPPTPLAVMGLSGGKNGQPMLGPFHDSRPMISPFVSVRKKRKKTNPSCNGDGSVPDACSSKEQHCRSDTPKRTPLVSDLPVSCSICGVTLRQSRNLRRHMELMHLKPGSGERKHKGKRPLDQSTDTNNVGNQTQGLGGGSGQGSVEANSIGSGGGGEGSRVGEDSRMQDGRQQMMQDPRQHPSDQRSLQQHDGRPDQQLPPHYSTGGGPLCEPIHPFLHLDPSYMARPAELYRHQQA